jgi:hypothetical protein
VLRSAGSLNEGSRPIPGAGTIRSYPAIRREKPQTASASSSSYARKDFLTVRAVGHYTPGSRKARHAKFAGGLNSHSAVHRIPRRLILYNVCTVDLAFYALCEFYAFRKSTTCVSPVPCAGSTPAASTKPFISMVHMRRHRFHFRRAAPFPGRGSELKN